MSWALAARGGGSCGFRGGCGWRGRGFGRRLHFPLWFGLWPAGGWRRGGGGWTFRQHLVVACDRGRELLDQHAELVDLADHALHAVGAGGIRRHHLALDRGQPAAELGDLAGEVGGAAGEVGDLAADVGAVAQPHRDGVVEDQEGQRG